MRNQSRLAGTQYLFMMVVWVVMSLLLGLTGLINRFNYYSSSTLAELGFLIPVVVLLIINRFEVMRGTRMKVIGIRTILWTILFTVLILPVTYYLNLVSQLFVPNAVEESVSYFATNAGQNIWANPLWLNILYIAILPPLDEEFIFRGVLFQGFRNCGLFKTAFFTALMFGLAHGNLNQFMYAFAIGLFLAYLVEACDYQRDNGLPDVSGEASPRECHQCDRGSRESDLQSPGSGTAVLDHRSCGCRSLRGACRDRAAYDREGLRQGGGLSGSAQGQGPDQRQGRPGILCGTPGRTPDPDPLYVDPDDHRDGEEIKQFEGPAPGGLTAGHSYFSQQKGERP